MAVFLWPQTFIRQNVHRYDWCWCMMRFEDNPENDICILAIEVSSLLEVESRIYLPKIELANDVAEIAPEGREIPHTNLTGQCLLRGRLYAQPCKLPGVALKENPVFASGAERN